MGCSSSKVGDAEGRPLHAPGPGPTGRPVFSRLGGNRKPATQTSRSALGQEAPWDSSPPPTIHEERQRRLTDVGENDAEGGGQLPLVLVPRELEHALPLLPPKVKAWWVQHVGEAEAVDSVRFAEMVFSDGAAGELVREVDALLGDIGDHRSSEPAAAPAPHGSGTSAMNGSSYGSRGTGPRSPFLAGYVIPHLTDWHASLGVTAPALLALHAACCRIYTRHRLSPPDSIGELLACLAAEFGVDARTASSLTPEARDRVRAAHSLRSKHMAQLRQLHGVLCGDGFGERCQVAMQRLDGTMAALERELESAVGPKVAPGHAARVVAYLAGTGTGKSVLASSLEQRGAFGGRILASVSSPTGRGADWRTVVERLALQLACRDRDVCAEVLQGARELSLTQTTASKGSSFMRGIIRGLSSVSRALGLASSRGDKKDAAPGPHRGSRSWNQDSIDETRGVGTDGRRLTGVAGPEPSTVAREKESRSKSSARRSMDAVVMNGKRNGSSGPASMGSIRRKWAKEAPLGSTLARRASLEDLPDVALMRKTMQKLVLGPLHAMEARWAADSFQEAAAEAGPESGALPADRRDSGLTGVVSRSDRPAVVILDGFDALHPAVAEELISGLSQGPAWLTLVVTARPTEGVSAALKSSNATFIAHEASRDARDIAAACDMLVTSSAPLSRSWLSDAGAAERRDQEAQRMAKATGGSYAFLGTLLRCGWRGSFDDLPSGPHGLLDWAYKKAQERLDPAAWAIVESRVLPKLIQASHDGAPVPLRTCRAPGCQKPYCASAWAPSARPCGRTRWQTAAWRSSSTRGWLPTTPCTGSPHSRTSWPRNYHATCQTTLHGLVMPTGATRLTLKSLVMPSHRPPRPHHAGLLERQTLSRHARALCRSHHAEVDDAAGLPKPLSLDSRDASFPLVHVAWQGRVPSAVHSL